MDRDASEWTKYPNSPLQLTIDTSPSGGAKISLRYENTSLEYLDTEEIDERFGSTYGKKNPPLVAICKQPGIGFKYLVRRFHTMVSREGGKRGQHVATLRLWPLRHLIDDTTD